MGGCALQIIIMATMPSGGIRIWVHLGGTKTVSSYQVCQQEKHCQHIYKWNVKFFFEFHVNNGEFAELRTPATESDF